jgi:AcrR family transcriptional regulator
VSTPAAPTATATPAAAPIQERAQLTRERLLEAAIDCFTRAGYDAASTRQIESLAGVKRGLIAYHFGSKEALWKAAATHLLERWEEGMRRAEAEAANVDPTARLRFFIRSFVRFSAAFPEVNRLMIREGIEDDWRLDWMIEHGSRPLYAMAERLFEQARSDGAAPEMPCAHFFYILVGGASLFFSMAPEVRRLTGLEPTDEAVIARHADALAVALSPSPS